jgi:alkylhydroperoxidase family enzyme
MIDFALKLTREPALMRRRDIELLKQSGLSEEQAVDVVLITFMFNFMNRLADGSGVELDPQMQKLVKRNADKG